MLRLHSSGWFAVKKKTETLPETNSKKTPIGKSKKCFWFRWWMIFSGFSAPPSLFAMMMVQLAVRCSTFPTMERLLLRDGIREGHATSSLLPILIGALTHRLARFKIQSTVAWRWMLDLVIMYVNMYVYIYIHNMWNDCMCIYLLIMSLICVQMSKQAMKTQISILQICY